VQTPPQTSYSLDEIWGSHGDYHHVVVEVFGFGTVCICRLMPTFRRNMLSPSSGVEVTKQGSRGVFIGPEEQGLRTGSQSEGGNMGTGWEPIGSLQEGCWEGAGCGVREREKTFSRAHWSASCSC
jgi:hypothetical protein